MIESLHGHASRLTSLPDAGRMLLDTAAEGYCLVDADLVATFVNGTLGGMLGYRADELEGGHLLSIVAPESLPAVQRMVALRAVLPRQSADVALLCSDGTRAQVILNASSLTDHAGAVIGMSIFVTDVTRRHADEVRLRRDREQLAAASLRVNHFLEQLSATLMDSVSAVLGFADALEGETSALRIGAYAASCREAGNQMVRVLDDVAHWARIQADEEPIEPRVFDVAGVIQDAMEWAGGAARRRHVTLVNRVADLPVLGDVAATTRVLRHLLENAVRYSLPGTTVTVEAREEGGRAEIRVVDQGMGIPAARMETLFRLDAPHATPDLSGTVGSGMGLMICDALLARMGGTLRLESVEGAGTTAALTLPLAR